MNQNAYLWQFHGKLHIYILHMRSVNILSQNTMAKKDITMILHELYGIYRWSTLQYHAYHENARSMINDI